MSLSSFYYGRTSPSRFRRFALHALVAGLAIVGYGFWVDFAPTSVWYRSGFVSAVALTVVVSGIGFWANGEGHRFYAEGVSSVKKASAVLVLPLLLLGLAWIGVVFGIGALITQIFGSTVAVNVVASRDYSPSRRSCDHRLRPELPSPTTLKICLTAEEYGQLQARTAVTLRGRQSMLGLYVSSWVPANKSANTEPQLQEMASPQVLRSGYLQR